MKDKRGAVDFCRTPRGAIRPRKHVLMSVRLLRPIESLYVAEDLAELLGDEFRARFASGKRPVKGRTALQSATQWVGRRDNEVVLREKSGSKFKSRLLSRRSSGARVQRL